MAMKKRLDKKRFDEMLADANVIRYTRDGVELYDAKKRIRRKISRNLELEEEAEE